MQQQDLADALKPEGAAAVADVAATWDKMEDGNSDSSQQLLAQLLCETPNPQVCVCVVEVCASGSATGSQCRRKNLSLHGGYSGVSGAILSST